MTFYSGFSLRNEQEYFQTFSKVSQYTVSGFSFGAIKAFEDVKKRLEQGVRVDTLQLFSPAFFQTKSQRFKRLQTLAYTKSETKYLEGFLVACFSPYAKQELQRVQTSLQELEELLSYEWLASDLEALEAKGVVIEVYLGEKDAIVEAKQAQEFFMDFATVTYIKHANHFLQRDTSEEPL